MVARNNNQVIRLKALAHSGRLQILEFLSHGPSTVGDVVTVTGWRQPYVSQQLAVLHSAGLVGKKRSGLHILHYLEDHEIHNLGADIQSLCRDLP